jgi:predicted nuclease of predicted toxin-antitoxin system
MVDAQLPRQMATWFNDAGCDAMHTLGLPGGNASTDEQVLETAAREQRIVITKDEDFVNSHLLFARPEKLLLISTGNIANRELKQLILPQIPALIAQFQIQAFIELGRTGLIIRG